MSSPVRLALATIAGAALLTACHAGDAADFSRQWERDRQERIAGMKEATRVSERGQAVEGEALRQLLSGRTHEFDYAQTPSGDRRRYVEYGYFRPDGHWVFMNTAYAFDPEGHAGDHWRIEGPRLCVLNTFLTPEEQCFRIAVRADGRVQYYIDAPGKDTHGLLTKVTDAVLAGPPPAHNP